MNISKAMSKAFDFSICTTGKHVPTGPDWLHEVKHDGYRMMVVRNGDRVRLLTKGGHDWSSRYPFIVETALRLREKHFVIDGEAVVLDVRGFSDFGALHSRQYDQEAQLYAFDLLSKVQSVDQRMIRRRRETLWKPA
jgi:bifunctional non-homologous end joining protein LigD